MKRLNWILGFVVAALVGTAFAQLYTRPLETRFGFSQGISYYGPDTVPAGNPGEVGVQMNADGTADLMLYDTSWVDIPALDDAETVTGNWTFSGSVTANGDVGLGSDEDDELTFNGQRWYHVFRENFENGAVQVYEEDLTAQVLTDGADGVILFPGGQIGSIAYTIVNADNLAAAAEPFGTVGVFEAHDFVDAEDNNNATFLYPALADGAVGPGAWNESGANSGYCETRVDIADISGLDDLWFGFALQEAYDSPPASATYNTSAFFVISDNAGDLDIETQLNGGGLLNDDTGVTWADGITYILRVVANADTVEFWISAADAADGAALTQVTQSNAILNFDDGDRAVCVFGWTNSAEPADPTITLDYVEYGHEQ